jgi:hypothetical protein
MKKTLHRAVIVLGAVLALTVLTLCKSNSPTAPPAASGGPLSGSLQNSGSQYAFRFTQAGSYAYFCTVHPSCSGLAGTVVVVGAGTPIQAQNHSTAISISGGSVGGPYGGGSCSGLSMPVDSVRVNETVTWTNDSTLPHTVTSR